MNDDACSSFERAFDAAWSRSDEIFNLIPTDRLLERPISLRHPFLFYLGHLPAFAWNQVGNAFLGEGQLDPSFDTLFERGIDPADDDRAREQSISSWPGIGEVITYRDRVRSAIRQRIPEVLRAVDDVLGQHGRILHVAIEHELMHHETLMYMLAQCPEGTLVRPKWALPPEDGPGKKPELREVPAGMAAVGAEFNDVEFGWDNEFGKEEIFVPAFRIDSLPVRNRDWLEFIKSNQLDERWLPAGWLKQWRELFVRTVFGLVPFELAEGWPVQVSREQAWAYCAWRGGRLPTEADLHRAAYGDDHERMRPWSDVSRDREAGDFGFSRWYPSPTGRHPASASVFGVEELVGNGWEWTCTPFLPRPGFKPYIRSYPGYSADFFDGEHDVVFGASWATDPVFLRRSFRNWYRSNYPYAFTKFRVCFT
ncbi:MAG: SUMF1/EgtB/PvdO family nonheme iron enzyme [Polyangiaceae bacterium]|nr:SUMF1/EgtB/PvdO family nonheme iron enzyme [Polyangiaceae bacterium]